VGLHVKRVGTQARYIGRRQTVSVAETKLRNVRVDKDLWDRAQSIARERRETLSDVMRRALVEYVERYEK
jgi:hypothetical protein